jgi:hypothetical protein
MKLPQPCNPEVMRQAATQEVIHWAKALLAALNVGDVKSESPIHKKLREVMIRYREAHVERRRLKQHGN